MQRAAMYEEGPPPSYESVVSAAPVAAALGSPFDAPLDPPFVPPRYLRPTGGRNSIRYSELAPLFDTTRVYLVDNKSTDVASLNYQNDHSNFLTTVIQNNDYSPGEASTQTINLDDRSHWGGDLKTILHTNMPNVNEFMFTNKFKARVMVSRSLTKDKQVELKYEWVEFTLPEGNYSETMTIDLMNNAIVEHYLKVGRQNGVLESDIGVKFDTRNFRLGFDPVTGLVMPGVYTNEAFHPDIILLPGCGVDFTHSRLSNLLGIRKRQPFQEGFRITYDDLEGGNIPALLDVDAYQASLKDDTEQGGDGAGGGNNSGSGAEENSNAAAAAMQPVEDMNDHAIRGDTFATRAEANQAVQNKINSKLDPRPPVEEPPPAVETVSPEGRGEKRPRPDREETLNSQIDEPPSYEEALKQGLPTTRPIAPMATGVLGQHTPVTLDLPPPADTQQKPVLPGPSAVVVTRPSRASLRRAASGPRSTL